MAARSPVEGAELMKHFNTFGACVQNKHYMGLREHTLDKVLEMIEKGFYLIISRPRQYGKTTLLSEVGQRAFLDYEVVRLSLDELNESAFETEREFVDAFCQCVLDMTEDGLLIPDLTMEHMHQVITHQNEMNMQQLMTCIRSWCRRSPKPVV